MEHYKRTSVFSELKKFCHLSDKDAYIEVTEWKNGDGFDVDVYAQQRENFSLTWGQYDALKKSIKYLGKVINNK